MVKFFVDSFLIDSHVASALSSDYIITEFICVALTQVRKSLTTAYTRTPLICSAVSVLQQEVHVENPLLVPLYVFYISLM